MRQIQVKEEKDCAAVKAGRGTLTEVQHEGFANDVHLLSVIGATGAFLMINFL